MWSGIGGLLVALLALGIRCIAISAEQDSRILPSFLQHFPHAVHVQTVEELKGNSRKHKGAEHTAERGDFQLKPTFLIAGLKRKVNYLLFDCT